MKLNKESYERLWVLSNNVLDAATKHQNDGELIEAITTMMTEIRYADVK